MANVNIQLSNTAAQIDQTISQTYNRLTGNFVGPLTASSNSASGFVIQNGNKQSGLFIGNSSTQFYNNCLKFDSSNSDTCLYLFNNRSFYLEQLSKPILGFYKVVLKDKESLLDYVINYTNDKIIACGGKKLSPSDFKIED